MITLHYFSGNLVFYVDLKILWVDGTAIPWEVTETILFIYYTTVYYKPGIYTAVYYMAGIYTAVYYMAGIYTAVYYMAGIYTAVYYMRVIYTAVYYMTRIRVSLHRVYWVAVGCN